MVIRQQIINTTATTTEPTTAVSVVKKKRRARIRTKDQVFILNLLAQNMPIGEIARKVNCSPQAINKIQRDYSTVLEIVRKELATKSYQKADAIISDLTADEISDEKPLTRAQIADILLKHATKLDGSAKDTISNAQNIAIFLQEKQREYPL